MAHSMVNCKLEHLHAISFILTVESQQLVGRKYVSLVQTVFQPIRVEYVVPMAR